MSNALNEVSVKLFFKEDIYVPIYEKNFLTMLSFALCRHLSGNCPLQHCVSN